MEMVFISVVSCACIGIAVYYFKKTNRSVSLESRLQEVNRRIASEPDDPMLHLLLAELLVRNGARWSALKSLEKAFNLGLPLEEMEPTFWDCYSELQIGQPLWRRLQNECPKLIGRIGIGMSQCEARYRSRMSDTTTASDKAKRFAILKKFEISLEGLGDE